MTGGNLRLQILGPPRIWRHGTELDPGPRQQAYLLAVLLARSGTPTSMNELVDLVWADQVPASAANILQKYIGALRRLLEPTVPARATGSFLRRHGSGYLFAADSDTLDVVRFRELVGTGRAERRRDAALDAYVRALGLWHGPAGDGLAHGPAAMSIFAALDAEFFDACLAAAEVAVAHGQPGRVLQPLHLAARMAPLNEAVHASLALALAAAGQQAQALALLRTVRARLAEELGVDPGPALVAAFRRVLDASPAVEPPDGRPATPPPSSRLVGRVAEIAVLRRIAASASTGGTGLGLGLGLGLVEGEPGVGKTSLLEQVAVEAEGDGALVVWGRCMEGDVAPSMWPWVQAVGTLVDALPPTARQPWLAGELGRLLGPSPHPGAPPRADRDSQFRLFEQVVSLVRHLSRTRPVVLLVDDLHWADAASLGLFGHLATRLPGGTAMFGALRSTAPAPGAALTRMLASAGRLSSHRRIRLGPLASSEVTELVRRETGRDPDPVVAHQIYARTGGNAFFVRELSRLLTVDGTAARSAVPSTVRDIVRDRTGMLDDGDRRLVETAALMGPDIDVRLLASASGLDVSQCLARLESLESHGLVEVVSSPLAHWRFVHDLVRESVVLSTTRSDASRCHLRIADVLAHTQEPAERHAEALAHHLCSAGPLAEPKRAAEALIVAGRIAARRSAYDTADKHLDSATRIARGAGLLDLELTALTELTAVSGIHAGFVGATMDHLDRAEEVARSLGQERQATGFLLTRFLAHAQGIQLDEAGSLARRLLDQGRRSPDPVVRASGHHAWGVHQWSSGNIGAAYRSLSRSDALVRAHADAEPLRHRLQMMTPVMLALNTALHGDPTAARDLFDAVESDAGGDPYALSIWGSFAVTAAAAAGDVAWARQAADTAIAADPDFSFTFSGTYPRLARHWATAMSGDDAATSAIEAEGIIESTLVDPPRSNLATWYALLAEIQVRAGDLDAAIKALDKAEAFIDAYGERYAEGLVLLVRAATFHATGDARSAVRAARRALALSRQRGANLFAARAGRLLGALPAVGPA